MPIGLILVANLRVQYARVPEGTPDLRMPRALSERGSWHPLCSSGVSKYTRSWVTRSAATAGDTSAADFDAPPDMDSYPEQPFMNDADMPAEDHRDQSPGGQAGGAAEEPSGGLTADAAQGLPGSASAAAEGASSAPADTDMPTPMAGKAVQQLVRLTLPCLLFTHIRTQRLQWVLSPLACDASN